MSFSFSLKIGPSLGLTLPTRHCDKYLFWQTFLPLPFTENNSFFLEFFVVVFKSSNVVEISFCIIICQWPIFVTIMYASCRMLEQEG